MGKQVKSKKTHVDKMDRPATLEDMREFVQYVQKMKAPLDVREFIRVDMVFDGPGTRGWVHTHGMFDIFGLPDLEIRDVNPIMLMPAAGVILNHMAQYMVDGQCGRDGAKPYQLGQTFGPVGHGAIVSTRLSTPINPKDEEENETHFSTPRYFVHQVNVPVCTKCEKGIPHAKH
jgi:hypothetical protein